jgi:hypothetical protein
MSWKTKLVRVRKVGSGEDMEVTVHPDDTAEKILSKVKASSTMVLTADPQRAKAFGKTEALWEFLEEGMQLYAAPPTPLGR